MLAPYHILIVIYYIADSFAPSLSVFYVLICSVYTFYVCVCVCKNVERKIVHVKARVRFFNQLAMHVLCAFIDTLNTIEENRLNSSRTSATEQYTITLFETHRLKSNEVCFFSFCMYINEPFNVWRFTYTFLLFDLASTREHSIARFTVDCV